MACLLSSLLVATAYADDDEHGSRKNFTPIDNPTYKEQCGACHTAYQPDLLPSGSWKKILSGLGDHHGENVVIAATDMPVLAAYLEENAAEYSRGRRAGKIMRSLGGQTPERITDVPYIRHKHHEIEEDVFERESIGSRSNCAACHFTAEQGVYDDDYVRIPK